MVWVDLSHKLQFQLMLIHIVGSHLGDDVQAINSIHNITIGVHMYISTYIHTYTHPCKTI